MLQTSESETEILLGNKQLLGVFFLVAALLGVAFTGGYMLGRGSAAKKIAVADSTTSASTAPASSAVGETHSVTPAEEPSSESSSPRDLSISKPSAPPRKHSRSDADAPLGSPSSAETVKPSRADGFAPESGQEYLQVTAVARQHADAVAGVLRKKGFSAHAVPKPGDPKLYRVIVGPIHDAGELASTRDSLRKTGFSNVIVQHYQ